MSDTSDNPIDEPQGVQESESDVELVDLLAESVEPDEDAAEDEYFDIDGEQLSKKEIKELKAKEASMQSDYTKKTMALAEDKKQFEQLKQRNEQLAQNREQALSEIGESAQSVNQEIEQLNAIDWDVVREQYPEQFADLYAAASVKYSNLQREIGQRQQSRDMLLQQRDNEEIQQLVTDIPDLADPVKGPELARKMQAYCDEFGLAINNSRIGKLVSKAMSDAGDAKKYRELVSRAKSKSRPNASSDAPAPPAPTKANTSSSAGLNDNLPMDEWLKRRNAQVQRR